MKDTLIGAIQAFTLQARADLEREAHEQLEGLYGWLPDGEFAPVNRYPALAVLDEARATRARLEQYARDEAEAGIDAAKARRKLVRETAFTWLNRFVAFKMLEARRLIKTLLAPPERSNAYLLWLADENDPEARKLHDAGDTPVNAVGEGPRQTAYRRFLLWQCGELAREMSVLFDPGTLASRLCSRPNVLRTLTDALNAENLTEAWIVGNEETIGWVYQGFNTEDKAAVFASFQAGKKITTDMIAAATGIFTPRWVVRYLVENSVGRLWMEMHPDSTLKDKLAYLVPPAGEPATRPVKLVREILFLDPSCGSMHFGLVAFDLFVDMYREEITRAGQPGWLVTPSVTTESDIPSAIVAHNLHGIDIDPRAVQIAALTLLIKARGLNREAVATDRNLACCNVEAITGGRLNAIIQGAKFDQPVYERILRAMSVRLKDSDSLGSLLRPERDLERLIDDERGKLDRSSGLLPGLGESDLFTLDTPEKREKFFAGLALRISQQLDEFVRQSRTSGKDESHFVGEASKGLNFLRLVQQRYDVVATNPPYLDSRDYSAVHKAYLEEEFPSAKRNLFAAFIQRCLEMTDPRGYVGMLTGQSFMFISSYEALRKEILEEGTIATLAQYDYHLFKERVDTAAFVLRTDSDTKRREASVGVYFRLVKERDAEAKRLAFESALATLRAGQPHPQVFPYKQSDFDAIPGKPWIYWMTEGLKQQFKLWPLLHDCAPAIHGTGTYDNTRFLRFWWEVGIAHCMRNVHAWTDLEQLSCAYVPYMKGGAPIPWFGNQMYVLKAQHSAQELREFLKSKRDKIRAEEKSFDRGVTWSLTSSKGFAARISPGGFVFDVNGMTCFPSEELIPNVLGLLNSRTAEFLLSALNPTIAFQVGDIERLPVPSGRSPKIVDLVNQCVELARQDSRENETTYDFIQPLHALSERAVRLERLRAHEAEIDAEVSRLYGLSEEDLAAIDRELTGITTVTEDIEAEKGQEDDEDTESGALGHADLARSWISYAVGVVLGRFEIGKPDGLGRGEFSEPTIAEICKLVAPNGILLCDPGQPQDLAARTVACLNLMFGTDAAREAIQTATGETGDPIDALRSWLDSFSGQPAQSFWRYHIQQYRKRPVYWPLQSPKRLYTVWLFHEKLWPDTLFHIRTAIVEPRLRLAEREIADLRGKAAQDRRAGKALDKLRDLADDLRAFSANLKTITDRGYTPHIDDGVLLNAAPLHTLLPSWPDTRKAWQELEAGEYGWAHQAMDYWPERVREKCKTNKSFAIAHGLALPEVEEARGPSRRRRGRKKAGE